jgi:hypothetical protein
MILASGWMGSPLLDAFVAQTVPLGYLVAYRILLVGRNFAFWNCFSEEPGIPCKLLFRPQAISKMIGSDRDAGNPQRKQMPVTGVLDCVEFSSVPSLN